MTVARQVYLICDFPRCPMGTGEYDACYANEARAIAQRLGWKRINGKDICDRHKGDDIALALRELDEPFEP